VFGGGEWIWRRRGGECYALALKEHWERNVENRNEVCKAGAGGRTADLPTATGNVMVLRTQPINRPTLTPSRD
jgi:hypothetical protein